MLGRYLLSPLLALVMQDLDKSRPSARISFALIAKPVHEGRGKEMAARLSECGRQAFDAHLFICLGLQLGRVDIEDLRNHHHTRQPAACMPNLGKQGGGMG